MSNDKQWFWTKICGVLFVLFAIVSSCVGVANMHFSLERRVVDNKESIDKHEIGDEKKWDKAWLDIDDNSDDIGDLKLQNARLETQYQEILRRLETGEANDLRILDILSNFEVIQ
jgi:hypothetical protein